MINFAEALKEKRRSKYAIPDIHEFAQMLKSGYTQGIPDDLAPTLVKFGPQDDDTFSLWVKCCLEDQGLTCKFVRQANNNQIDVQGTCSHMDFMCDAFFERAGDCIVLGSRGSGKTVGFAAMLFIEALYKPGIELAHLGAIKTQADKCYDYFKKMVLHPLFADSLAQRPLASKTLFKNGSKVEILIGSMTGVNCLHGDTLVECSRNIDIYPSGIPMRELVGKTVAVPTVDERTGTTKYLLAKGMYSGKAPCVQVTLQRLKRGTAGAEVETTEIVCTKDHPIFMDASHKYRSAGLLQQGQSVYSRFTAFVHTPNEKYGSRHCAERRIGIPASWDGANKGGIQAEHRLIAEAIFGTIPSGHVVHHIDGNRLNNDINNLRLEHASIHHMQHFGEDSQAYIDEDIRKQIAKTKSIAKNISLLWRDKTWLTEELSTKTVCQVAYEQNVHGQTICRWAKAFDLQWVYSDEDYTPTMVQRQMRELARKTPVVTVREPIVVKQTVKPLVSKIRLGCKAWHDKTWLENELQTKPLTQIAYENDTATVSICSYAKKFGLSYKYSSPAFTEAKVRQKCKETRKRLQAERLAQYDALSPEQKAIQDIVDKRYKRIVDRENQKRTGSTILSVNYWTVVSVQDYANGTPQDVYDLQVESDTGYNHNFFLNSQICVHNSPHPSHCGLDEVELMEWKVLQEAFNMARSKGGYLASTRLTSTRKFSTGSMQKLIDEAKDRGLKLYQWNVWDTIETCQMDIDSEEANELTPLEYVDIVTRKPVVISVPTPCLACSLVNSCKGQAKFSNAGQGVVTLGDTMKNYAALDEETWIAQIVCQQPGRSDLIYPMFEEAVHVIDYKAMLQKKHGEDYQFNHDINLPVYAGQDAGFGCPATVYGQVIDDDEGGDPYLIIFDENYDKDIAPSVFIRDTLRPKQELYNVDTYFIDPSGQALTAELEIEGLYVQDAENDVEYGLDIVKALLATRRLFIDQSCKNYIWELKRYKRLPSGKPLKKDDHLQDAGRYLAVSVGVYESVMSDVFA